MLIILQAAREKITHKKDNLVIKVLHIALLNRNIVFIYNNNRRNTIMLMQSQRQISQRIRQLRFISIALLQTQESFFIKSITPVAIL